MMGVIAVVGSVVHWGEKVYSKAVLLVYEQVASSVESKEHELAGRRAF